MHSCRPLVIGRSCGWMTSRPLAVAAASPRRSRSYSFWLTKSAHRWRSLLSTSSCAAKRKSRSSFEIPFTSSIRLSPPQRRVPVLFTSDVSHGGGHARLRGDPTQLVRRPAMVAADVQRLSVAELDDAHRVGVGGIG